MIIPTVVQVLVRNGADPNLHSDIGGTPLVFAIYGGDVQVLHCLPTAGARPRETESAGCDPLQLAIQQHHPEMAALLHASMNH
jgi:hypothetical protein